MKKKRNLLLIILIILIPLVIIILSYFAPRILIVLESNNQSDIYQEAEEVPLVNNMYSENFKKVEVDGISISLPIHNNSQEEFGIHRYKDLAPNIRGNNYNIIVWCDDGGALFNNPKVESSEFTNYTKTINEYSISCLSITKKDLTLFQPIHSLRLNQYYYDTKNLLINMYGDKYTTLKKDNLFYLICLDIENETFDTLRILVYDTQNNYDLILYLDVFCSLKEGMSIEEISFITDSIAID